MKLYLFLLIILTFLISCSQYKGFYTYEVENCSRSNKNEEFGTLECNSSTFNRSSLLEIEDNILKFSLYPNDEGFDIQILNKSKNNIKVVWDECVIVKPNGESSKVIHKGVKYIDKEKSQNPSLIIGGSKLSDIIIPVDNIRYVSGEYGGWKISELFQPFGVLNGNWAYDEKELEEASKVNFGKSVSVLMTVLYDEIKISYTISTKTSDYNTYKWEL